MGNTSSDVIRGTLDMLILKTVASEPMHGWGICEKIPWRSQAALRVQPGSLSASLHRLPRVGWVRSYCNDTENNRRARYYPITRSGLKHLDVAAEEWTRLSAGVARILAANT
jgi:transcriptional regulator